MLIFRQGVCHCPRREEEGASFNKRTCPNFQGANQILKIIKLYSQEHISASNYQTVQRTNVYIEHKRKRYKKTTRHLSYHLKSNLLIFSLAG